MDNGAACPLSVLSRDVAFLPAFFFAVLLLGTSCQSRCNEFPSFVWPVAQSPPHFPKFVGEIGGGGGEILARFFRF